MAKLVEEEATTAPAVPPSSTEVEENKENQAGDNKTTSEPESKPSDYVDAPPSPDIEKVTADLLQSRTELLGRVQNLKKDLQDWRGKLDSQVKTYRQELGELRSTLNTEVEQLKNEFQALRTTLRKQLDNNFTAGESVPTSAPEKVNPSV